MISNNFEWDDRKAAENWRKHGVDFEWATSAFRDAFAVERIDQRHDGSDERTNMLAMCDGIVVHITYSEVGERIRLISARRAMRSEQDRYFRENSND